MRARSALVGAAMLAAGCSGEGNNSAEVAEAPDVPVTTTVINTEPAGVATSTTEPPATTTTEPEPTTTVYLAPSTTEYLPPQTTIVVETSTEWAIPTYIVMCESGGDWDAYNASGASGPYQIMPMHFGGELAMNQSRAAQHAKAAELWDGGAGKSHWAACL